MPRPIGGFFELELPPASRPLDGVALNSGRACLTVLLRALRPRRVHVPFYTCQALLEPLEREQIPFDFYALDEQLAPSREPAVGPDELFVAVDYLGCCAAAMTGLEQHLGDRLVIDATQAFFRRPSGAARLFTSARKFFGVPDGAFLHNLSRPDVPAAAEAPPYAHLLERWLGNQGAAYTLYQEAERAVSAEPRAISPLSAHLLSLVDLGEVVRIRRRNFARYREALGDRMLLAPGDGDVPFFFPLWWPHDAPPRRELAAEQIFVPRFWADVEERTGGDFAWEREVSRRLVPLPIDQRYTEQDCDRVIQALQRHL